MMLSEHFSLAEACKSQTAVRLGIANTPPAIVIPKLQAVAEFLLEPVRAHFGKPFTPSSWYRSPALNRAIGSKDTSQHVKGEAVDFEVPGVPNLEVAAWIRDTLDFDMVLLEFYRRDDLASGWVHCSFVNPEKNRKIALAFDGKVYTAGLGDGR